MRQNRSEAEAQHRKVGKVGEASPRGRESSPMVCSSLGYAKGMQKAMRQEVFQLQEAAFKKQGYILKRLQEEKKKRR